MKKLLCFLFGHRPGKGLFEDEDIITDKGCSHCGQTFMTDAQDEEARKEFSAQ